MDQQIEQVKFIVGESDFTIDIGSFNNLYEDAPEAYDILCEPIDFDQKFTENLTKNLDGVILEVGCRTGRLSIPMAINGVNLVAIEKNLPMLKLAMSKAKKTQTKIRFYHGDIRSINLDQKFKMVLLMNNYINEFLDCRDFDMALERIHYHLESDGKLIISGSNANGKAVNSKGEKIDFTKAIEIINYKENDLNYTLTWSPTPFNFKTQLNLAKLVQSFEDEEANTVFHLVHRIYFPAELAAMLERNNFKVESIYGDHNNSEWTIDSPSIVAICTKK